MPPKPKVKAARKRKLPPEEEIGDDDQINLLPENIILEILRCLPVKEKCIASRVCKKWRRILSDNSLWRHVDLLPYKLQLNKMWKVLRTRFSSCLLTMKIRGYAGSGSVKPTLSDAMMKELSSRCPNLWSLQLHFCNMENFAFSSLPNSLTSLSITFSIWPHGWMKGGHAHLPNLTSLDLTKTVRIDRFDLADIAEFTEIKKLSLVGCYRVAGSGFQVIAEHITGLEKLELSHTSVDDLSAHHIARHLKSLKELYLLSCKPLSDSCLATLASGLENLEILDVSYNEAVTLEGLASLKKLKKLKKLYVKNVSGPDFDGQAIKSMFEQEVSVQFRHSEKIADLKYWGHG